MEVLKLIFDFLLKLADGHQGLVVWFVILFSCLSVIILFLLVCQVFGVFKSIERYLLENKELNTKRNIYHRFAEIARSAQLAGGYVEASNIMAQCALVLFGKVKADDEKDIIGDDKNARPKSDVSRSEESVSRESGQGSDRTSDGPKESYAKVTD